MTGVLAMGYMVNMRSAKSRREYLDYLSDLEARFDQKDMTLDEHARWVEMGQRHNPMASQKVNFQQNIAREREYVNGWESRNPGQGVP